MNNFWQRLITSVVFVAVIVGLTLWSEYGFLILLSMITVIGLYEFYRIVSGALKWIHYVYMGIGLAVLTIQYWMPRESVAGLFLIAFVAALSSIYVLLSGDRKWRNIGYLVTGIFYIPLPLALFLWQVSGRNESSCIQGAYNPLLALNLFILIWSSDTFAYLSGRAFGKHKLFPAVSPGKTWEGLIGGVILTIGFSFLLGYFWNIPYQVNIAIAICTVVFGTLGDLVESMLKREFEIKDSGNILPGHGGILDRFDALLISLPFTSFCYYCWQSLI